MLGGSLPREGTGLEQQGFRMELHQDANYDSDDGDEEDDEEDTENDGDVKTATI